MAKKESYDDMLKSLEEILDTLETNELNIEDAMKEYEKGNKIINKIDLEKKKLEKYNRILGLNSPLNKIANAYQDIDSLKLRLDKIIDYKIQLSKTKLFSMNSLLQAHNPLNILSKGYAIIEDEKEIIKSIEQLKNDKDIEITLKDGKVNGHFIINK